MDKKKFWKGDKRKQQQQNMNSYILLTEPIHSSFCEFSIQFITAKYDEWVEKIFFFRFFFILTKQPVYVIPTIRLCTMQPFDAKQ